MKKLFTTFIGFIFMLSFGVSQNLELVAAEKFEFRDVRYELDSYFDGPLIICNHANDLSYYGSDFDAMDLGAASLIQYDDNDFEYLGSFTSGTGVRLYDTEFNHESEVLSFLLKVTSPCAYESAFDDPIYFDFPVLHNMTGIIQHTDNFGEDVFWASYLMAENDKSQRLWTVGDLTIITGFYKGEMTYVDRNGIATEIVGDPILNLYAIALDSNGEYKWSKTFKTESSANYMSSVVSINDEILFVHYNFTKSNLEFLDFDGQKTRDDIAFFGARVDKIRFDDSDNMIVCGNYLSGFNSPNISLNGEDYILDQVNGYDGFLIQYSPEMNINWVQYIKGSGSKDVRDFDLLNGDIYITGGIEMESLFDSEGQNEINLISNGNNDIFIAKYSNDGNLKWVSMIGGETSEVGYYLDIVNNNISLFGVFLDQIDLNPDTDETFILQNEDPTVVNSFYAEFSELLDVSTKSIESKIGLSPNPANSILTTDSNEDIIISINSFSGKVIGYYNSSSIDVSDLPNGMYIVKTENNGEITSQLISIIH